MNSTKIQLLDRFMRGETSPEEEKLLLAWFREEDAQESILTFYREHWIEAADKELPEEVQLRMLNQIKLRMKTEKESLKETKLLSRKFSLKRLFPYAAAVILCAAVGISAHLYTLRSLPAEMEYLVEADKGQRANMTLPDGTKVWLNSHTQISYKNNYGVEDRTVKLTGEAFFEVAKDKEHRFIVKTDGLDVEALGTSFNVKAYREDKDIVATLFSGSIRAISKKHATLLSPDQQVRLDRSNGEMQLDSSENVAYARMWRNSELAFEGETLNDIAIRLNRLYNVHVEFKSEKIKKYRFSGVIKNNSLDNVFEIISLTAPIIYESLGDTIVLSEKQ